MSRRVRFSSLSVGLWSAAILVSVAPRAVAKDVPFTTHIISTTADAAVSVFAADVDGDGDIDILSASAGDDKIVWYVHDPRLQPFPAKIISTTADGAYSVFAADVDGDGDTDVLSASYLDDKIAWYENKQPLFGDGFESGDLSAWSSNVPF